METMLIYATLSAIKEKKTNVNSILEIYQDLVETAIKKHFSEFGKKGFVNELQETISKEYHLNIPIITLEMILRNINKNYGGRFHIYNDHSFDCREIEFIDVTDVINEQKVKIEKLNKLFQQSKEKLGISNSLELIDIIEKNKRNLLAYFNNRPLDNNVGDNDFDLLISFLRIPEHKEVIESLFLGALISCFTELDPERIDDRKTMLLDTNFIISLMDLHSVESLETCKQIIELGNKLKYDFCILPETLIEIRNLLRRKSREIIEVPLFAAQDRQSIEFGCYRKGLSGSDLLVFEKMLETFLRDRKIRIIDMEKNGKLKQAVIESEIYRMIQNRPRNKIGAIHDAMAMNFIKEFRTGEEDKFSDTASFFVTDSHGYNENKLTVSTRLPLIIRAEELITLLWLVFPFHDTNLIKSEISKIFSMHLDKTLPNKELLSAIDKKNKSFKNLGIRAKDCVNLAFEISIIDASDIEKLLSISDEDEYLKEIGRLAYEASERRDKYNGKMSDYVESIIDMTWEEKNKELLEESSTLRNEVKEKEREQVIREKHIIENEISSQREIIDQLQERIEELNSPIKGFTIFSQFLLIFVAVFIILFFGIKYIIPNWNDMQAPTFIIKIILPFVLLLSESLGISQKNHLKTISKLIVKSVFRKRIKKLEKLKIDLRKKTDYVTTLDNKNKNIIY